MPPSTSGRRRLELDLAAVRRASAAASRAAARVVSGDRRCDLGRARLRRWLGGELGEVARPRRCDRRPRRSTSTRGRPAASVSGCAGPSSRSSHERGLALGRAWPGRSARRELAALPAIARPNAEQLVLDASSGPSRSATVNSRLGRRAARRASTRSGALDQRWRATISESTSTVSGETWRAEELVDHADARRASRAAPASASAVRAARLSRPSSAGHRRAARSPDGVERPASPTPGRSRRSRDDRRATRGWRLRASAGAPARRACASSSAMKRSTVARRGRRPSRDSPDDLAGEVDRERPTSAQRRRRAGAARRRSGRLGRRGHGRRRLGCLRACLLDDGGRSAWACGTDLRGLVRGLGQLRAGTARRAPRPRPAPSRPARCRPRWRRCARRRPSGTRAARTCDRRQKHDQERDAGRR